MHNGINIAIITFYNSSDEIIIASECNFYDKRRGKHRTTIQDLMRENRENEFEMFRVIEQQSQPPLCARSRR